MRADFRGTIDSVDDLAGRRVARVKDYAYGEEIAAVLPRVESVVTASSAEALDRVRAGEADVALVDDLVAREQLGSDGGEGLKALATVLAFRSLHFAMSRAHPDAEQVMADFHRTYQLMLMDGTVNDILGVDWLAIELDQSGTVGVVMRSGASLDSLAHPEGEGSTYALEQGQYDWLDHENTAARQVRYLVDGKTHASLEDAMYSTYDERQVCEHEVFSETFDCGGQFDR